MEEPEDIPDDIQEIEEEEEKFEEVQLDPKEINDLLFLVQSLGCTKTVGNVETYLKSPECIEFLKEIYKILRNENPESPLKRLELGEWNVVESDLIKLLVSYPEDRQLAFYTIIVLVSLTEKAEKGSINLYKYIEYLQNYKLSFITSKEALKVIVNHLADCLSKPLESRNEQHDQMLELITYLFRNLLAIPDKTAQFIKANKGIAIYNTSEDNMKDLQRRFLHKLADESILDAFVYMCQDFTPTSIRKLNLCFLEIFCHSFNSFSPKAMWNKDTSTSLLQSLRNKAQETDKLRIRELSSRHSKFGSSYKMARDIDGVSLIYHNPFKQKIELNKIPGQSSRSKPQRKENMNSLSANRNMHEIARVDKVLIDKIKHFANEVLEHCFSPILESIFTEFYKDSERLEDHDKTNYFLFQAFFMEYLRYKHYYEAPVLDIDVSAIYGVFQKMNFEYFYRSLILELKKTAKKEYNTRELHASIKFCIQYFYIIKDMQGSASETTRRNGQILMQTVFYREVSVICKKSFEYWRAGVNDKEFLEDIIEFTYLTFKLLEDYSKGKSLTVRTERILKSKKSLDDNDEEFPGNDEATRYQERQLNYVIEFSQMIDPDIVSKYCFLLKRYRDNRDEVNTWVLYFIKKIIHDCEADWIFFQLEYLQIFDEILCDRLAAVRYKDIYDTVSSITTKFFQLFSKNKLLPVECLFRVRERNIKNQILSNYQESIEITQTFQEIELEGNRVDEIENINTGNESNKDSGSEGEMQYELIPKKPEYQSIGIS
jgi:Timeless protein